MEIIDLDGKTIKVTDLDEAIRQAKAFCGFRHTDEAFVVLDAKLELYWNDVYRKLLALKV